MKREKTFFVFILVPFFLFSLNLNLFKIGTGKTRAALSAQQPASSSLKENSSYSDKKKLAFDKDSLQHKTSLSKKINKKNIQPGQSDSSGRYRLDNTGLSRIERIQIEEQFNATQVKLIINRDLDWGKYSMEMGKPPNVAGLLQIWYNLRARKGIPIKTEGTLPTRRDGRAD